VAALEDAYNNGKIITSVDPIAATGSESGGFKITFSDNSTINIINGKDGENGKDGIDGNDGQNGNNGTNGITPLLKIDHNGIWCVSYDGGISYSPVLDESGSPVKATGEPGNDGADGKDGVSVRIIMNDDGYYVIETYITSDPDNVLSSEVTPYLSNPSCIIKSIIHDNIKNSVTFYFADGRSFEFPIAVSAATGIVIISPKEIMLDKGGKAVVKFRINPSDADLDFNIDHDECQIAIDLISDDTRSSLVYTAPENFSLIGLARSMSDDGCYIPGQYEAILQDNDKNVGYSQSVVIVVKSSGVGQISSEPISVTSSFYPQYFATGLPLIIIDTPDHQPIVSKDEWMADARMSIYEVSGNLDYSGSLSIKGRGNSTWGLPKNPYALKLDAKDEILGMPKHKRWCLLADYYDPSYLRNNLVFWIGNKLSNLDWTPRTREVNLILNGKYCGQYLLTEQIKIDKNRVNVDDDGFLMEIDNHATNPDETDPYFTVTHIHRPIAIKDYDELPGSIEYITNFVTQADALLFSENYLDAENGWKSMIDMNSFVEWYIVNEITKNNDSLFFSSCYMNLKKGEKLKMGPLWDYDLSMGNYLYWGTDASSPINNPEGFYIRDVEWYSRMFTDPEFVAAVKYRFNQYYDSRQEIFNEIDNIVKATNKAYSYDFDLWWRNGFADNSSDFRNQKASFLKDWLSKRLNWLKTEFNKM